MALVAGFDGWRKGWIGVVLEDRRFSRTVVAPSLPEALAHLEQAAVIGIDMPIGLVDTATRAVDHAAKRLLGARSSTVYLTPAREVLAAESYAAARDLSTRRFGRSISAQAYALRSRILEVDPLAHTDRRIHEVHPELAFLAMNGGIPLDATKKSWQGQMTRRRLLAGQGIDLPEELGPAGVVPPDDVLDAAAVAWTAARIAAGRAARITGDPAATDRGRDVAIWY